VIAVVALVVLGVTERLTDVPGLALSKLRVSPAAAPVTVLEALVIFIPLTVSEASLPVTADAKSKSVPVELMVKFPPAPDVSLVIASLEPEESSTILAFTPRPASLIADSRSLNVFTVPPVVIVEELPLLLVMVMLSAGRSVVSLDTVVEM